VEACWRRLPRHFVGIELDACVVMPNHLHGVIIIGGSAALEGTDQWLAADELGGPSTHGTRPGSLGAIVQNFKSVSTRRVNQMNGTHGPPLWQRNYYERVIRNERELNNVREYIEENPSRWQFDEENPDNRETKHSRHRRP
jgi:putative transposase